MLRFGPTPAPRTLPIFGTPISRINSFKTVLFAALFLTLSACGGGGGSDGGFNGNDPPANPPPPPPSTTPPEPVFAIGKGSGTTFTVGAIDTTQTTLLAGQTTTLRVNIVVSNRNNEPPTTAESSGLTVDFSSTCSSSGLAAFSQATNVSPGLASIQYTNNGCEGPDTVTARLTSGSTPGGSNATVQLTMVGPDVLTVSFVSSTNDQLALAGIGGNESTELTFKVAGAQGVPIVGKQVSFSINAPVGTAFILAGRETGITDQEGLVRTVLNSGTVAGPVSVRAVHLESGKQGLSQDIIISTGVPVANRFSISYSPFNPVGAFNTDGVEVTINIIASDAFGNNPTDGTRVSFVAPESGNVQSSCQLVEGACSVVWRSTSPRPTDGRAEVIAFTDGAENFVDTNGNSVYDAGDGMIADIGEPYADENEDGNYDLGEYFFDSNLNGVRNSGNGRWDGPCLDAVNATAICTGEGTVTIFDTITIVMSTNTAVILFRGNFPPPGSAIAIANGFSTTLGGMRISDDRGNPPPIGTTIAFAIQGGGVDLLNDATYTVPNTTEPVTDVGVVLLAEPLNGGPAPANVYLQLNITVPGQAVQQYSWPITVI